jgi:type IV fimbrial biogenesis protein FimT
MDRKRELLGNEEGWHVLKPRSMQHGVSLIELMIGLVILAILLAFAVPAFSQFIQNSKIRNAAGALQDGLNLARGEAVRRNTNVQFILNSGASWTVACEVAVDDLDGDGVPDCPGYNPTATSPYPYIENRTDAEGGTNVAVTTSEVSTAGVASSSPLFTNSLTFNGLGKVTSTTLTAGKNAVIDVSPTTGTCAIAGGSARCMEIVVTPAGQIRMCDPKLHVDKPTDPQAC